MHFTEFQKHLEKRLEHQITEVNYRIAALELAVNENKKGLPATPKPKTPKIGKPKTSK